MNINDFKNLKTFLKLTPNGSKLYLVGGAVRDLLVNKPVNDLDCLLVDGNFNQLINNLKNEGLTVVEDGLNFLHIKTFLNGTEIEVSVPRKEAYRNDSRNPIVVHGTLQEEIERRDFSINALLLDLEKFFNGKELKESILDLSDGLIDLENKILRTNNNEAQKTLSEDPVRVLRALRFKTKYNLEFSNELKNALENFDCNRFKIVSKERIRNEFIKCLNVNVNFFEFSNLIKYFFEIDINTIKNRETVITHINKAIQLSDDTNMKLVALLHDIGKFQTEGWNTKQQRYNYIGHEKISTDIAKRFLKNYKFTNKQQKFVVNIVAEHMNIKFITNRKVIKQIKYVLKHQKSINDIVKFNAIDWQAKPISWQVNMDTNNMQQKIVSVVNNILNNIPDRQQRLTIAKQKGNFIDNLAIAIRSKII